ncbi:MAG: GTP-binding protein, partial [Desulfobacterales bacterium]|nr:GTP-binding protein [Desulfobacterales bacterium]
MTETLRNIALIGHGGSGKTSLAEVMLFNAGATNRFGSVDAGNSVMDFEPEELKRRSSISTGFHQCGWKKHQISIMDTPGDQNFFSDTRLCLQAADSAVVVLDGIDGVKVQSEKAWEFADEFNLPRVIFINKLDRERSDFQKAFKDASDIFHPKPIILQIPIGAEAGFKGIVDLIQMKAFVYENGKATATDIPEDLQESVEAEREKVVENIAEADDELVEKYLDGQELTADELKKALRKGTVNRTFVPVLCGSATNNIGIDLLCNFIVDVLPAPADLGAKAGFVPGTDTEIQRKISADEPFSALVFKTIADPYSGRLTIFKVISGKMAGDGTFYNTNRDAKERYTQLLKITGKEQKPVSEAGPGDIVAVAKLKETKTGDTLCNEKAPIIFAGVEVPPPIMSFAIEPKSRGDEEKIASSLHRLTEEDPTIVFSRDAQTKEMILSGMGQVHIE